MRAYGQIPHLPDSRRGPGDKGLSERQAAILTEKARDKHDLITVQEKLDGSCVAVAKINGSIVPLIRSGYEAISSRYDQHRFFANWVFQHVERFNELLQEGERCIGEWLMEAHGTRYNLKHEPLVIFDLMREHERQPAGVVKERCGHFDFVTPRVIHMGGPIGIDIVVQLLEPSWHGAIDPVEGAVWRVERHGVVDFLGKYVRPGKVDGCYLENVSGKPPVYNWKPENL